MTATRIEGTRHFKLAVPEMICIYCQRDLSLSDFSREHVIPRAFGSFEQNLTLVDLVCAACNQYFGETIDFALARGSAEAVHRLDEGVKPPQSAEDLRQDRVRITWTREGDWNGVLLRLTADPAGLVVEPVPQALVSPGKPERGTPLFPRKCSQIRSGHYLLGTTRRRASS